jgi:hypothetical protein
MLVVSAIPSLTSFGHLFFVVRLHIFNFTFE